MVVPVADHAAGRSSAEGTEPKTPDQNCQRIPLMHPPRQRPMGNNRLLSRELSIACAAAKSFLLGLVVLLSGEVTSAGALTAELRFQDYQVATVYKGKTRLPDFSARDKAYRHYRTRIREGLKEGPSFAGEFSIIQIGCGTGCSFAFVASNRSGKVFEFPRGGKENMFMQFSKKLDSRLLILQWGSYRDDSCFIEYFEWTGNEARPLNKTAVGNAEACDKTIDETLAN